MDSWTFYPSLQSFRAPFAPVFLNMARNRKYQSAAIRFGPAIKAVLLCILIGGSGVGYVWQKSQIDELGQQIRKREQTLGVLEGDNEKLRRRLAILCSPASLEAQIRRLGLGLVPPQPSQFWRLPEPAPENPKTGRDRQFAAQYTP